jgi:hydrogenase maturation protease
MSEQPILVMGLGNLLLSDDAVGLRLLEELERECTGGSVEFVDGGTQGIALTGYFSGRSAALILDAVGLGAAPGTVHVLQGADIEKLRARRATSAHEGNGLGLIETARLLGICPADLTVIGVEPAVIKTGLGLSPEVEAGAKIALARAREFLARHPKETVCA